MSIYGVVLANALNLLFTLLEIFLTRLSKLSLLPMLTPRGLSKVLFLIKESPTSY